MTTKLVLVPLKMTTKLVSVPFFTGFDHQASSSRHIIMLTQQWTTC